MSGREAGDSAARRVRRQPGQGSRAEDTRHVPTSPRGHGGQRLRRPSTRKGPGPSDPNGGGEDSDYSEVSDDDGAPLIHAFGHTYHGSGTILLPNDESERRRLDLQHEIFKMCLDDELTAVSLPTDRRLNIIDIGTGSGIWALEMGARYPLANILGVDITCNLLPSEMPRNVAFEIDDANDSWGRQASSFDLVHLRNLVGGGISDWKILLQQAYQHLRPGGHVEFGEIRTRWLDFDEEPKDENSNDGAVAGKTTMPTHERSPGSACRHFEEIFGQITRQVGVDFDPTPRIPALMSEVGFDKVVETSDLIPIRAWGSDEKTRRKGAAFSLLHPLGLENYTLAVFARAGWKESDTRALLDKVLKELSNPGLRGYGQVVFITAKKPENAR